MGSTAPTGKTAGAVASLLACVVLQSYLIYVSKKSVQRLGVAELAVCRANRSTELDFKRSMTGQRVIRCAVIIVRGMIYAFRIKTCFSRVFVCTNSYHK